MVTAVTEIYIVDYDLPMDNRRRRFYRAVQAYLVEHDSEHLRDWSTQSVVITDDREFADFVYAQASQLGQAHMYKATQVR